MNKCIECRETIYGGSFDKDRPCHCWKCIADARFREFVRRHDDWYELIELVKEATDGLPTD